MMRLSNLECDGCGRSPGFIEWVKGELTNSGYPDWRHPGLAFKEAGIPLTVDNRAKCEWMFEALFGRPLPHDPGYFCPDCFARAIREFPQLPAADTGSAGAPKGHNFGK